MCWDCTGVDDTNIYLMFWADQGLITIVFDFFFKKKKMQ